MMVYKCAILPGQYEDGLAIVAANTVEEAQRALDEYNDLPRDEKFPSTGGEWLSTGFTYVGHLELIPGLTFSGDKPQVLSFAHHEG